MQVKVATSIPMGASKSPPAARIQPACDAAWHRTPGCSRSGTAGCETASLAAIERTQRLPARAAPSHLQNLRRSAYQSFNLTNEWHQTKSLEMSETSFHQCDRGQCIDPLIKGIYNTCLNPFKYMSMFPDCLFHRHAHCAVSPAIASDVSRNKSCCATHGRLIIFYQPQEVSP